MSSSAIGLEPKSRVTPVAGASGKPGGKVQHISKDCLTLLSFLTPVELALAKRVNRSWRTIIGSIDPDPWKAQRGIQNTIVVSPAIKQALTIQGKVCFYYLTYYIYMRDKGNKWPAQLRWGSGEREPFVTTQTYSESSPGGASCQCTHPRLPKFPPQLPLRFFINRDGSYKLAGDKIKLRYRNQAVVLTCTYDREWSDKTCLTTFAEGLAARVELSLACRYIYQYEVDKAKAAAAISGEWIASD